MTLADRKDLPVAAILDSRGVHAPRRTTTALPPQVAPGQIAITVANGIGDYRTGDVIWCTILTAADFPTALNRDVLVPQPAGQLAFGRLTECNGNGNVTVLPPDTGTQSLSIAHPIWIAVAVRLVREL